MTKRFQRHAGLRVPVGLRIAACSCPNLHFRRAPLRPVCKTLAQTPNSQLSDRFFQFFKMNDDMLPVHSRNEVLLTLSNGDPLDRKLLFVTRLNTIFRFLPPRSDGKGRAQFWRGLLHEDVRLLVCDPAQPINSLEFHSGRHANDDRSFGFKRGNRRLAQAFVRFP